MNSIPSLRAVRPAPEPLGLYFRGGRNDHMTLSHLLSAGHRSFFGIVFDASRAKRHKELIDLVEKSCLECILHPCTQASTTVGGYQILRKFRDNIDRWNFLSVTFVPPQTR
jgi:hypothetical protein